MSQIPRMSCGRPSPLSYWTLRTIEGSHLFLTWLSFVQEAKSGFCWLIKKRFANSCCSGEGLTGVVTETGLSKQLSLGKTNGGCFHLVNWLQAYLKTMDALTIWIKITPAHFPTRCGGITSWYGFANLWATSAYSPVNTPHLCLEKYQCKRWQLLWLENMFCVPFSLEVLVEIVRDSNAV